MPRIPVVQVATAAGRECKCTYKLSVSFAKFMCLIFVFVPYLLSGPGPYPGFCSWGCNSKAKGCKGNEFDEDEAEKVKTFLRSG